MSNRFRILAPHLSAILAATSVACIPGVAIGQAMLEEVVVTARKREESLQETPVAVSAFSGETMQQLGINDIADLTKVVPNVDMYSGNGTSGTGNVFIRGIGARNTGTNFDSGVGIYVDGVYVSRADGAVLDNVDLQSVQVLRGPQGTLFGKNTTGGAILYTTNKPEDEYGGHVEVRVGNYNQIDSKATVNIPLAGDTLMSRFSLYQTKRDGYVHSEIPDNLPTQAAGNDGYTEDDYNDVNRYGGQAQLRWVASDDLLLDLNYNYGKTDQAAQGQDCQVVTGLPGAGWQVDVQDPTIIIPSTGQGILDWCQANADLGKDKIMANLSPNKYEAEVNSLSLTADWEINDTLNFKSISAWRNTKGGEVNELDAMGIPLLGRTNYSNDGGQQRNTDAYSQEFQLLGSAFDERLDYVVGVFGFHEETNKGAIVSPTGPFFNALGVPGGMTNFVGYTNALDELLTKNSSASLFTQADWHFDEYWTLTLGARYTWEERRVTVDHKIPNLQNLATTGDAVDIIPNTIYSFPSGPDTFNPNHGWVTPHLIPGTDIQTGDTRIGAPDPLARQNQKIDDSKVTPMGSIQRTFDGIGFMDFGNAYFTVANGFLSGGISDTYDLYGMLDEFDPEEVWNYEIGFKMDAWDHRLRLNTAVFYTDYKDRQLTTVRLNPFTERIAGALINAKSSWISGIEMEAVVIPMENLQITANVTFNDSEIEEYDDEQIIRAEGTTPPPGCVRRKAQGLADVDVCEIDRSDEDVPRLPDSVFYLAVQYTIETDMGSVEPMLSWSYRTNLNNCFDASSCLSGIYKVDQEDVTARLSWYSPDMAWRVTAFGRNLTDDRYITGGTPLLDTTSTAAIGYNQPRTYGLEAAYTW
ncbi:MAG: TonB-dependent receptor [Halioglobus sp.]|nr:TonB-dependent receptor [Halioglobus sp.]